MFGVWGSWGFGSGFQVCGLWHLQLRVRVQWVGLGLDSCHSQKQRNNMSLKKSLQCSSNGDSISACHGLEGFLLLQGVGVLELKGLSD